jgi:hypothetical protein
MKTNKDPDAVSLGRRGGKAKNAKLTADERKEMMEKVRANRWPPKIHTLKKPCPQEGCKVTNGHEHI